MAADTKLAIETALSTLLGVPLTAVKHVGDMRIFCFGDLRPSARGKGMVGSYALHVQCSWRLTNSDELITGYFDYHVADNADDDPNREDPRRGNRQQVRLEKFFGSYDEALKFPVDRTGSFVVTAIEADRYGSVDIILNDRDICLRIFADSSAMEDWRFFSTDLERPPHFVIFGGKVQDES